MVMQFLTKLIYKIAVFFWIRIIKISSLNLY